MTGYEVANTLRSIDKFAGVRLIAISGYDTPEARERSLKAGFNHHVGKPVNLESLQDLFD
jgi:CheY-like chemotaxis protein